jgi:hypothetical protein
MIMQHPLFAIQSAGGTQAVNAGAFLCLSSREATIVD